MIEVKIKKPADITQSGLLILWATPDYFAINNSFSIVVIKICTGVRAAITATRFLVKTKTAPIISRPFFILGVGKVYPVISLTPEI